MTGTTYPERLATYLAAHPDAAATGVLHTSTCATCGVAMEDRVNTTRTDHSWHAVGLVETIDPWQRLDELLADGDVSAYSAAKAHRGLAGRWPWDHNHLPASLWP